MKVIIAGGRDFDNYNLLKEKCNNILSNATNIEIVEGGAKGADTLGKRYGREKEYLIVTFPANWDEHGKAAGVIRNRQMAEYADCLIAFFDGKSRGTKNIIEEARKRNLKIRVINY